MSSKCANKTGTDFLACVGGGSLAGFKYKFIGDDKSVKLPTPSEFLDNYQAFLFNCVDSPQDPENILLCLTEDTISGVDPGLMDDPTNQFMLSVHPDAFGLTYQQVQAMPANEAQQEYINGMVNVMQWNYLMMFTYSIIKARIQAVSGNLDWADVWPEFYHPFDTQRGRYAHAQFIAKFPDAPQSLIDLLRTNFLPEVQAKYCLLNTPDWPTFVQKFGHGQAVITFFSMGGWGGQQSKQMDVPDDIANQIRNRAATFYDGLTVRTIRESQWDRDRFIFGNPFWSHSDRANQYSRILGTNPADGKSFITDWAQSYVDIGFISPGKTPEDYFDPTKHAGMVNKTTDADYQGMLPYKVPYVISGAEPWHLSTVDPKQYGYKDPCIKKSVIDEILPIAGAVIGGACFAMITPGQTARIMAAGVGGAAAYEAVGASVGYSAVEGWEFGNTERKDSTAAIVLSAGIPATLAQAIFEIGLVPAEYATFQIETASIVAAGAAGYFVLNPILQPVLVTGGAWLLSLQAPIAGVSHFTRMLFNGCAEHEWTFGYKCDCEQAANKPLLADALLQDVYGVTGKQLELRREALYARMTTGSWGTDPHDIGFCDDKGHMDDPSACVSAGEWAWQRWPKSFEPKTRPKWEEIEAVFDPANPSFLPPLEQDQPCAQYGKYFRKDLDTGKCYDYRAPIGQQEPGYQWPKDGATSGEKQCTIL